MSVCFRRLYATLPKPPTTTALAARTASSPLQVRRRRQRLRPSLPPDAPDTSPSGLSPTEEQRYQRLKRSGALIREENGFREPGKEQWLTELNDKRSRIRGTLKKEVSDPDTGEVTSVEEIVGKRIYLPNIIFRMMRNHTLPGKPYNPWEATFRIPQSVTKLDIRSYLFAVYGVKCTYIRTDNYIKPVSRGKLKGHPRSMSGKSRKTYKRAVVGLVEPFYYPEALEDMNLEERTIREKWLEESFRTKEQRDLIYRRKQAMWRLISGWRSFNLSGNRGAILRNVLERRKERERVVDESAEVLLRHDISPMAKENTTMG